MTGLEISLIIIGVIIFVGSFFFTEKLSSSDIEAIHKLSEKEVKNVIEEQVLAAKTDMDSYIGGRSEEAIDHIDALVNETANKQLLSIGEYSDTILDSMQKTQNENLEEMKADNTLKLLEMKDDTLLRKYNPKKAKSQHKSEPTAIGGLFGDIFDKK